MAPARQAASTEPRAESRMAAITTTIASLVRTVSGISSTSCRWDRSIRIDYQVTVEMTRFDGRLGGDSVLIARWRIFEGDGRKLLVVRKSSFTEPAEGDDHEAMVSAMNRALTSLSREIAAALQNRIK